MKLQSRWKQLHFWFIFFSALRAILVLLRDSLVQFLMPVGVTDLITHMSVGLILACYCQRSVDGFMWSSLWQACDAFFHRDPEERLVRREKQAHPELLDPPAPADPLGMTVPRATPYVPSTVTYTAMTDAFFKLSAAEPLSYSSVELSSVRHVVDTMSNIWVKLSLLSVFICLQGPVGFPGDPGPPGEPGAAVSATFIPQSILCLGWCTIQWVAIHAFITNKVLFFFLFLMWHSWFSHFV